MKISEFNKRIGALLKTEESLLFFQALERLSENPRRSLRISRLKSSQAGVDVWTPARLRETGILCEAPVPWCEDGYFFSISPDSAYAKKSLGFHPAVMTGSIFIQEAGAMEPVGALDPKPGEWVLDLCAAPGAKSTQIGERIGETGWLCSNDPVNERAKLLDTLLMRHGISRSTVVSREPHLLVSPWSELFDKVLVDAPCSGESLFGKRKEKRDDISDEEVRRCADRQLGILASAVQMLRPGGRLVYSTCTYSREENEDVVEEFLNRHPELVFERDQHRWPHQDGVPGGYFAVFSKKGEREGRKNDPRAVIQETLGGGLIRHGTRRWKGELDVYLCAMDRLSASMGDESTKYPEFLGTVTITSDRLHRLADDLSHPGFLENYRDRNPGDLFLLCVDKEPIGALEWKKKRFEILVPKRFLTGS